MNRLITPAGRAAACEHFAEICPDLEPWKISMMVDLAARDWSHGLEEQAMKALSHDLDLTGVTRVIAAMLAASGIEPR